MVAVLLTWIVSTLPDRACDLVPSVLFDERRSTFSGFYKNESFGYSVVIPDSLNGYDTDQATHHGFGVILGEAPQSYLDVQGRENTLAHRTARKAADRFIRSMSKDGRRIKSTTMRRSKLGALEAVEVVVRYTCGGAEYRVASTFALSPMRDLEFQVALSSLADRFARDRAVLDQLLKSWIYVGR